MDIPYDPPSFEQIERTFGAAWRWATLQVEELFADPWRYSETEQQRRLDAEESTRWALAAVVRRCV